MKPESVSPLQECQQGSCHQLQTERNLCVVHQHMAEEFTSVTGDEEGLGGLSWMIAATDPLQVITLLNAST